MSGLLPDYFRICIQARRVEIATHKLYQSNIQGDLHNFLFAWGSCLIFFPLYDQIYLLPDETHFKFGGLTCLQEATTLTACYLQNTTPGSRHAAEISALPFLVIPCTTTI